MTDTPATDRPPLDLDAIRANERCARCLAGACDRCTDNECGCHAALRAELDAARAPSSAFDPMREPDETAEDYKRRLLAARAERTEPATGEVTPDFGTASPSDLALLAKATSGGMRSRDVRPEYVDEPATGEDLEVVARALFPWLWVEGSYDDPASGDSSECYDAARAVLAALDLPRQHGTLDSP